MASTSARSVLGPVTFLMDCPINWDEDIEDINNNFFNKLKQMKRLSASSPAGFERPIIDDLMIKNSSEGYVHIFLDRSTWTITSPIQTIAFRPPTASTLGIQSTGRTPSPTRHAGGSRVGDQLVEGQDQFPRRPAQWVSTPTC